LKLRLYFDEDSMDHALVLALQARGVDVVTALEAGMGEQSDEDHLQLAASEGRVLYTCNIADFCRLHSVWLQGARSHAGLILCQQQQYSVGEQLRRLMRLIGTKSAEEMINQVEFLSAWS
jgi:hypothetical protein